MPNQVTVTAQTGPAKQNTAIVLPGVSRVDFDLNDRVVQVYQDPAYSTTVREYELTTTSTVTVVNTGGNFAVTIA